MNKFVIKLLKNKLKIVTYKDTKQSRLMLIDDKYWLNKRELETLKEILPEEVQK